MKLTRKHLNQILLQLPNPRLVVEGRIAPCIKVPIHEMLTVIHPDTDYRGTQTVKVKELTFEYSPNDMDWVLKDLEI